MAGVPRDGGRSGTFADMDPLTSSDARRGHFVMESGYHSDLWLDLDALFTDPHRLDPLVAALATMLRAYRPTAVCGPLVGGALIAEGVARGLSIAFSYTERVAAPSREGLHRARYRPPSSIDRLRGQRVAIVDDAISAGSSLKATHDALVEVGATPVVAGALMVLGTRGSDLLATIGVPLETLARHPYDSWDPDDCPLCRANVPLEDVA